VAGKDEDYFATISEYISIEQFNNEKALERKFDEMLNEKTYYWKWTSEDRRATEACGFQVNRHLII